MNKKMIWRIIMYSFMVLCLTTSCKSDDDAVNLAITEAQVEQMTNNVVAVMDKISTKFSQCDNASDFYNAAVALKQMEGVKDVYESEGSVFVEFENSLEISYLFPPVDEEETLAASLERNISAKTRSDDAKLSSQHVHANMQSLCIVNQLYKDMKFKKNNDIIANLRTEYSRFPISFKVVEGGISRQFFSDDLYNYDMVFLMTHGCYNEKTNLHWILTGQELYTSEEAVENEDLKWKNLDQLKEIMRNHVNLGAKIGIGVVTEKRLIGGREKNVVVYYEKISNEFISNMAASFTNENAIVFNVACQSLKGNDDMAQSFIKRGAACYIGYDESNSVGPRAGNSFFSSLLTGKSVFNAFFSIPSGYSYQYNKERIEKGEKVYYDASIKAVYANPQHDPLSGDVSSVKQNICLITPEVLQVTDECSDYIFRFTLEGMMYVKDASNNKYGFVISKNKDMSDCKILPGMRIGITADGASCIFDDHNQYSVSIKKRITKDDIELGETYYVAAYMFDGVDYCLSEPYQFTAGSRGELGIFDLHGPVSKCTWDGSVTRTFSPNGWWTSHDGILLGDVYMKTRRDGMGRIIFGQFDEDGNGEEYSYNAAGRITKYRYMFFDDLEEIQYFYDDQGRMSYSIDQVGGLYAEEPVHTRYEIQDVDEYGNWTRRVEIDTPSGEERVVTRTIQYYQEN